MSDIELASKNYVDDKLSSFTPGPVVSDTCQAFRLIKSSNCDATALTQFFSDKIANCVNFGPNYLAGVTVKGYSYSGDVGPKITINYDKTVTHRGDFCTYFSGPCVLYIKKYENTPGQAFIKENIINEFKNIDFYQGEPPCIEFIDSFHEHDFN